MPSKKRKSTISSKIFNELAAKNVRKSAKDYFIYFFTLMLSVCLFYSFNSVSTQFQSLGLEDTLNYLSFSSSVLTAFSVLVCIIMGALVVYANRFLLKRRKKEMGIYSVLGMEQKDLNHILMKETLRIGVLSLFAGIIMGIFFAQILSLITAKIIGLEIASYSFMISIKGIILSIVFFGILFWFVHLFNVKELKKMNLLDMLYADHKNETVSEGNSLVTILLAVFSIVFILGGYGLTFMASSISVFKSLAIGCVLLIVGTVLFFTAALRIAAKMMKRNKQFYYHGLNIFTTSQFASRLKTEGRALAMTAVLIFLSLSLTVIGPGIGKYVVNGIEHADPYNGTISYVRYPDSGDTTDNPMEYLRNAGFDIESVSDNYTAFWTYGTDSVTSDFLTENKEGKTEKEQGSHSDIPLTIMGIEDYNHMLALQGINPVELGADEFGIAYAFPVTEDTVKSFERSPRPLMIGDTSLTLKENGIFYHGWENKNVLLESPALIVPQELTEHLDEKSWLLNFNYSEKVKDAESQLQNEWMELETDGYRLWTRQEVIIVISSDNLLITYLGIYLGITFLITAGAVLALQQLSQSSDNVRRYNLLKKLGVPRDDMRKSLFKQLGMYFGLPLILAVIHTAVMVTVIFRHFQGLSIWVMISVIGGSVLLVLLVYVIYFITTYSGSKRILQI